MGELIMSENLFTIELGRYGFMLDTEWCYIALSWQLIITSAIVLIAYKGYKRIKENKILKDNSSNTTANDLWCINE
jgi:hypothetical protein